jgi:small subunit ribosomal protein S21
MIIVRKNEPLEKALKRFKKKVDKEGIMRSLRDRQHYEKPSDVKRKQVNAAKSKAHRERFRQG